jgi:hypothetical protein
MRSILLIFLLAQPFAGARPIQAGNRSSTRPVQGASHSSGMRGSSGFDNYVRGLLTGNPIFRQSEKTEYDLDPVRRYISRDAMFYILSVLVLFLAVIRLVFHKYFSDLIRAFYNPTLSQRQLRDQLSQTPFPALLLNVFFTSSMGLYLFLLLRNTGFITNYNINLLIPSFILLIGAIYCVKYMWLRFMGWLFAASPLTDTYIFILYLINKVLGIVLLPFLIILAFCSPSLANAAFYISIIVVILLIVYRYIRAYGLIKSQISFNKFHFFLYFCAFEIIPVLVLGKIVLVWLNGNV